MRTSTWNRFTLGVGRIWKESIVDRYRLWLVSIAGIEVTQSIQHYHSDEHLTDRADRASDNSIQLVAYKAAWVRVYVWSGLIRSVENVTATLEVARRNYNLGYDLVGNYSPQGGATVTARQSVDYNTERSSTARTLNFVIPAEQFHGTLRLTARLVGYDGTETTITIHPLLVQTLRVRAILVAYNGDSSANPPAPGQPPITQLTLAAPTLANLQNTASMAFAAMPVQATGSFASCGTLNWATPLDDMRTSAGACSTNWDTLLNWLELLRDNDGNRADVVYYGLLPAGIPLGVPGCGQDGLGAGAVGDQLTFLHEIGHGYGFQHTPCGPTGPADPDYPTYEPYASASIGEFGLDIRNGTVYDPNTVRDYMSYCNPRWMSLYQHDRLVQHARLAPRWLSDRTILDDFPRIRPFDREHLWWPDPPWTPEERLDILMNPVISIVGQVLENGEIKIQSVARIHAAAQPAGVQTHFVAQLAGEGGASLARGVLFRTRSHGGGCGCGCADHDTDPDQPPFAFKAYIPDTAPGAALRILAPDGREAWVRQSSGVAPRFGHAAAELTSDRELALRWQVETGSEQVDVWVQWTTGEGEPWHGLAIGLRGEAAVLPLTGMPAGKVLLRLLAHDGFFTAVSDVLPVELPERPPEVAILYPRDGQTLPAGRPLQISGNATDTAGQPLPGERMTWTLNGEPFGHGRELWLAPAKPGGYELGLEVEWQGGRERTVVTFETALEQPPGTPPTRHK